MHIGLNKVYSCALNPSPAMKKMYLKMLSAEVICFMEILKPRTNFGIQSNSVDPDQAAHMLLEEQSDL